MNQETLTSTEKRPELEVSEIKTSEDLKAYMKRLADWLSNKSKEEQDKYREFAIDASSLLSVGDLDEKTIESLVKKLTKSESGSDAVSESETVLVSKVEQEAGVSETEPGFSPEALERTLNRLDRLVEVRKERRQKKGLSDQDVRKESESYNAIRSEIIKLRNRLKKIQEGEEVDLEEVRNLKSELLDHLAKYRAEMKQESIEAQLDEPEVKNKNFFGEISEEDLQSLHREYEGAEGLDNKINTATALVQARIVDLQHTFSTFESGNEKGNEQVKRIIEILADERNGFITAVSAEDITESKVVELTGKMLGFLDKAEKLIALQNQRYQESGGELGELIVELRQHFGMLEGSGEEVDKTLDTQATQLVESQYQELLELINKPEVKTETAERLKARLAKARGEFINATGGLDLSGDERLVSEMDLSTALSDWNDSYNETMSLLSSEYKDWQSAKASFREARRLLHEEMVEVQEKNRGLLSIFKKANTSHLEELGKEYERLEQRYINSLDRYKAYRREQLPADADINARTDRYEKSKLKTLGVWEGVKLSSLESPKGLRVVEQFTDLHGKFRNLPRWSRWAIGSTLILGTPFAASLIGGAGIGVAGLTVGKRVLRYGVSAGIGSVTGGFTFHKFFADRKFKKEQVKVDAAKEELSATKKELIGGSKEATIAEVRTLIQSRNNAYLQSLYDQKVRANRSGLIAGAVTGGAISGGLSFGLENLHDVTNGVGEVAGTSTGADTAPAESAPVTSTPSVGTTQPEQIAYSDQTEPIKVPEPDEHVLGRGVKPELNQPTVPSYGGVSDSIATPDSTEAGTASVHTESAAEVLPSETTVFSPKPYTIERGDTVWDWAEGQTNAPQPPAFAEVAPDKLRQLIHYTVEKIKDNPELAKSMGVNPYNNPSTWLFEGGTLTPEQQSMFSQIARSVAIERGY